MSNQVFIDPTDPSKVIVGSAAESFFGFQIGPTALNNVHSADTCAGRACVIHAPSDHHMRLWDLNFRSDRYFMERICPHGVGHADPDDVAYWAKLHRDVSCRACDGCCRLEQP